MAATKILVRLCEFTRVEPLLVPLRCPVDRPSAPARIDQLPPLVDEDDVPRVAGGVRREAGARGRGVVAVAFAVAAYDAGLQAGVRGEAGEEGGVAFADGEAGGEGGGWRGGLDVVGEEGGGVVGDVVVQPDEDGAGFVGQRGEGDGQLVREPGGVVRGDGFPGEAGGVSVGGGEVATEEADAVLGCGRSGGGAVGFRFGGFEGGQVWAGGFWDGRR